MGKNLTKVYFEDVNIIGEVIFENHLTEMITIRDGDGEVFSTYRGRVVELEEVGMLRDAVLLNHDVIKNVDSGDMFEIEKNKETGKLDVYRLDSKYERVYTVASGFISNTEDLSIRISLVDNVFKLRKDCKDFDFNVKVVKNGNHESIYYYACNNKEKEEIDLIKVVFVGHNLLEEEYKRSTMSYEAYKSMIENGKLIESSPMELLELLQPKPNKNLFDEYEEYEEEEEEYEEEEEEEDYIDYCPDCDEEYCVCGEEACVDCDCCE